VSEDPLNVLVAGYQDLGAAHRDFDVLCGLVKDKQVTTEYGVILVAKDPDGEGSLRLHRNRERVVFDLKPATHEDEKTLHQRAGASRRPGSRRLRTTEMTRLRPASGLGAR
jgi:hypothetical protein